MIPDSLWSLIQIVAGFALSMALGFGVSFALLPGSYRRYTLLAAPTAGYAVFCLAAVVISGNLRLAANTSVWIAAGFLLAGSAAALMVAIGTREAGEIWRVARPAALSLVVMMVVIFWPVIYQHATLYLGTANPDFYQSLAYQEVLTRFNIGALSPRPAIDYSLDPFFGTFPDPLPAKFGGVMFSMLQQKVLGISARAALMTSLVVFLLTLPIATYLFSKTVLEATDRVASTSAFLMAVSAPVTMSFIHVLVGQNSSLALLPLGISICYLAISTRDWRLLLLSFLILDAAFWVYVMILPYIVAPIGLYAIYDAVRNPRGAARWIFTAVVIFAAGFAALQWGIARETRQLIDDITALLGHANRTVYVDFLTEMSVPYSFGLTSYPMTSSFLLSRLAAPNYVAWSIGFVALAFLVLAFYIRSVRAWAKEAPRRNRDFALITLAIYGTVWAYFAFVPLYGYALFKMASWLQFIFMPFVAYGAHSAAMSLRAANAARGARLKAMAAGSIAIGLIAANVVSSLDFDAKGLGRDTRKGAIVNSYGIGGNPDYPALEAALRRLARPGEVIGIAMPDFIANLWTAYYVVKAGMRASFVSHDDFPDEDALLPDVASGVVRDTAGNVSLYRPRYHDASPAYYVLEGPANLNREITEPSAKLEPAWADGTFAVVPADRARDILVTGRGFYRLEFFDRERLNWWWPEEMRWTAGGGEFVLLNASRPEVPRRLSFVAIAGKEREKPRHLELWLNGRLFDEVTVHGAAKVVSKPFLPTGKTDKLVVKVREQVTASPRNFGLWNRRIATDPRELNLVVAQATVRSGPDIGREVTARTLTTKQLIDDSNRFDGIGLDGWAGPKAFLDMSISPEVRRARLSISIPGWAGFRFPFRARFTLNGRAIEKQFDSAGDHAIDFTIDPDTRGLVLETQAAQSTTIPGVGAGSFLIRSLRLD